MSGEPQELICPVCGYYCLGKGGLGCIDKPSLCDKQKEPCKHPGCSRHITHPCEGCGRQWNTRAGSKFDDEVISRMQTMCEESLDPERFDAWEDIKHQLFSNRSNLTPQEK